MSNICFSPTAIPSLPLDKLKAEHAINSVKAKAKREKQLRKENLQQAKRDKRFKE